MKKVFALLLALLLIFTFVGCKNEPNTDVPTAALYTSRGGIEICEVEMDTNIGSDAVKYVRVYARFINTSDEDLYMTIDSLLVYYDANEVALPYVDDDLYDFLEEHYGLLIDSAHDRISARSATFEEASMLDVPVGSALIYLVRVCYSGGKIIGSDHCRILGSRYEFEIHMSGRYKKP